MTKATPEIALPGLTRLEALELQRALQAEGVTGARLEELPAGAGAAGVLPLVLIVVPLGALAIQGVIVWLAKTRSETVIKQKVEVRFPDGRIESKTIEVQSKESKAGDQVERILGALTIPTVPGSGGS
jgi:hypothetical protein